MICKEQRTKSKKEIVRKLRKVLREQKDFDLSKYSVILILKKIIEEEE